jgi:hypothetical protein
MLFEAVTGVLTGFVGTLITTVANYKMVKLEQENLRIKGEMDIRRIEAESNAAMAEAKANMEIARTQAAGAVDLAEAQAFLESQKAGSKAALPSKWLDTLLAQQGAMRYLCTPVAVLLLVLLGVTDFLKELMRPGLTLYSLAIASWVSYRTWQIVSQSGEFVGMDEATAMWRDVRELAFTLVVAFGTWWFGDRRVAKNLGHMKESKGV